MLPQRGKNMKTRSTGTVHTSAKAFLTHAAIWWISMSSRFMSINHFPYLRIVTNPENNIDSYLDCCQNLIICSLAHCQPSLKISCKSIWKFLHKVANRQTDKQTNNDDYISSLAEVTNPWIHLIPTVWLVGSPARNSRVSDRVQQISFYSTYILRKLSNLFTFRSQ